MKLLMDTHTLLWYVENNQKLSSLVSTLLEDTSNDLYCSIVSFWEIAIKLGKGKLSLQNPFHDLEDILKQIGIEILPIIFSDTECYLSLPQYHNDPFDRMLIAQAINNSLVIASADSAFDAYSIQRVWA